MDQKFTNHKPMQKFVLSYFSVTFPSVSFYSSSFIEKLNEYLSDIPRHNVQYLSVFFEIRV